MFNSYALYKGLSIQILGCRAREKALLLYKQEAPARYTEAVHLSLLGKALRKYASEARGPGYQGDAQLLKAVRSKAFSVMMHVVLVGAPLHHTDPNSQPFAHIHFLIAGMTSLCNML